MAILKEPKSNIKDVAFFPTAQNFPYENELVEVYFKSGNKQVFTHRTENPNDLSSHDFENATELRAFYNSLV